jgi:hypothetical protein
MGIYVISLVSFWYKTVNESLFLNLSLILSHDVKILHMRVKNLGIEMVQKEIESVPNPIFNVGNEVAYLTACLLFIFLPIVKVSGGYMKKIA